MKRAVQRGSDECSDGQSMRDAVIGGRQNVIKRAANRLKNARIHHSSLSSPL
jgi:hypothetical protein